MRTSSNCPMLASSLAFFLDAVQFVFHFVELGHGLAQDLLLPDKLGPGRVQLNDIPKSYYSEHLTN